MTYDEIIAEIVKKDVAKWGEKERESSEKIRRQQYPTRGLALNKLAHYDIDHIDPDLAKEAKAALTAADWRELRKGG